MGIPIGSGVIMKNKSLAEDYLSRAGHRLAALEVLLKRQSYADVVREAQEIVELCLKALLRKSGIEVPRIHDVSEILKEEKSRIRQTIRPHIDKLAKISKEMRRDRELAFYGSEDLTPSEFYQKEDAQKAFKEAGWAHSICELAFS